MMAVAILDLGIFELLKGIREIRILRERDISEKISNRQLYRVPSIQEKRYLPSSNTNIHCVIQ